MWLLMTAWLLFFGGQATDSMQVELFDSDAERVVSTFENSQAFQQQAKVLLASVTGRVQELNPPLEHALIAKIPLLPPQTLDKPKLNMHEEVSQLVVVMPKKGQRSPYLIVQTKGGETLVVEFRADILPLRGLLSLS